MSRRQTGWTQIPVVRQSLVVLGFLLIASTPIIGPIPGPGGIFVFAGGLSLVLKYTGWAKRLYVRLKRKHPKKGSWADWSLRRASARRRHERSKQADAAVGGASEAASLAPADSAAADPARGWQAGARAPLAGTTDLSD